MSEIVPQQETALSAPPCADHADVAGAINREREEIPDFTELGVYLESPARAYSTGMTVRSTLAIAVSIEGDIILLDEWIAIGDASFRKTTDAHLRAITERTGILVMASRDLSLVRSVRNLGLHLQHGGRARSFGPIEEVITAMEQPSAPSEAVVQEAVG